MLSLISVALCFSAAGQIPLATEAELPGGQKIHLFADKLEMREGQQLIARGHAMMRAEGAVLRADELIYESAAQRATAKGNVMLTLTVGGLYAAVADAVTVTLADGQVSEVFVDNGVIMQKDKITAEQLLAVTTPAALRDAGDSSVTLSGTHLKRLGKDEWAVHKLSFTPCDCDPKEPSWRVEASRAVVDLEGKHATLTFPTVYVKSVPVFWLPWIYLPLSERRTGLLVPRPSNTSLNGFTLDAPVFVTLGESYDVTLTPGYFFGTRAPTPPAVRTLGVQGPRLLSEFRYVPSADTSGNLTLGLLYDLYPKRDPVSVSRLADPPGRRGLRGEASLRHSQTLGGGWFDRVDASAVSDGYYVRDLTPSVLSREQEYMRSTGSLFHRGDDHYAGLEVALRQDLHWGYSLLVDDPLGVPTYSARAPATFHKLPEVVFDFPLKKLVGPFEGSFRAAFTRLAPLTGATGDEGISANGSRSFDGLDPIPTPCLTDRLFSPATTVIKDTDILIGPVKPYCGVAPLKAGQGNGRWEEGEREPRDRLDLVPRVSASFGGRVARLSPYLGYRQDLYFGERTGRAAQRGYPLAGAVLESELSRTFGAGSTLRHAVRPVAELRYIPRVFGAIPEPYDDVDVAVPEMLGTLAPSRRRLLQLVTEVRQTLAERRGSSVTELIRLDLGQGLDLMPLESGTQRGETFARLLLARSPFNLSSVARYDSSRGRLTQVDVGVGFATAQGGVNLGYESLFVQGSDRTRAGIDTLLGPPPIHPSLFDSLPAPNGSRIPPPQTPQEAGREAMSEETQKVTGEAYLRFKSGLGLRYGALFLKSRDSTRATDWGTGLWLAEQHAGLSYGPACDCWRIELHATHRPRFTTLDEADPSSGRRDYRVVPDFGASLTISRFGTFGTRN